MSEAPLALGRRAALACASWAGSLALAGVATRPKPAEAASLASVALLTRIDHRTGDAQIFLRELPSGTALGETRVPARDVGSIASLHKQAKSFAEAALNGRPCRLVEWTEFG